MKKSVQEKQKGEGEEFLAVRQARYPFGALEKSALEWTVGTQGKGRRTTHDGLSKLTWLEGGPTISKGRIKKKKKGKEWYIG